MSSLATDLFYERGKLTDTYRQRKRHIDRQTQTEIAVVSSGSAEVNLRYVSRQISNTLH